VSFLDTLLGRKHAPMIGLDISSSSVKLVELGQTAGGEYVVERFGVESFEKGWIADGQIEKFDEVAEAVKPCRLQERHQDPPGRDGDAAVGSDHQEDHAAGRPA